MRWYSKLLIEIPAFAGMTMLILTSVVNAQVPHWKLIPEKCSIEFFADAGGSPVTGAFTRFTADIIFDPAVLKDSSIRAEVDMTSLSSADSDAMKELPSPEWFASKDFPAARFESSAITQGANGSYVAEGRFTIRGKSITMPLPFTLTIKDNTATADATFIIPRSEFGIGAGNDAAGENVSVTVHIEAEKQ